MLLSVPFISQALRQCQLSVSQTVVDFILILQSSVQLVLDFLSPESLREAARMAEEIRCLPNNHEAKLKMLEVHPIYTNSSLLHSAFSLTT